MADPDFEKLVQRFAERQRKEDAENVVGWQERQHWWVAAVRDLFDQNLLRIRHWVAHGRYWEIRWDIEHYPPRDVADLIDDLFNALRSAASFRGLMSFR
jgi:hypothetical protein